MCERDEAGKVTGVCAAGADVPNATTQDMGLCLLVCDCTSVCAEGLACVADPLAREHADRAGVCIPEEQAEVLGAALDVCAARLDAGVPGDAGP
ncbi:MAG: hypothetical protein RJA70_4199 [Pseudomonadota bacterium]